ncbi:MAG: ATP-binding protein [Frankiaceae bacterium]
MEIKLTLALPRDAMSVPVARRICSAAMRDLGVTDDCCSDIEIALTEACTNVLDHVADGDEYEVAIGIDDRRCVIEVVDAGGGFDPAALDPGMAELTAEQGRGVQIMRAVVDRVTFTSRPEKGTVCHLEKDLVLAADSPIRVLSDGHEPMERGPWSSRRRAGAQTD